MTNETVAGQTHKNPTNSISDTRVRSKTGERGKLRGGDVKNSKDGLENSMRKGQMVNQLKRSWRNGIRNLADS